MTDPSTSARFEPSGRHLSASDYIVGLAATATTFVAVWLLVITRTVLPTRDPGGIPFWTAVAVGLLGYVGLTVVYLRAGRRSTRTRRIVAVASVLASVAAFTVGGLWVLAALTRTRGFEGYLVLIGAILAAQGAAVLLHEAFHHRT